MRDYRACADIIRALKMDSDRQRRQLAARWGRGTDAVDKRWRRIVAFGGGLFALGGLGAMSGANLPDAAGVGDFATVVSRTESLVHRGREYLATWSGKPAPNGRAPAIEPTQSLERQLAALEALLEKLHSLGAGTDGGASLAADLEAAQEVGDMVEALIEAGEVP